MNRLIAEIRSRLSTSRRVVALTGPGPGAEEFAPGGSHSPLSFFEDPVAVWSWYDARRARLAGLQPTGAHRALADLEGRVKDFTLATVSVDGLHLAAGSRNVLELRGNIWRVRCTRCGLRSTNREVPINNPPSCPQCTGLVRPDLVWRGEHLPQELLVRAFEALSRCETLILAGAPSRSHPAAAFVALARKAGAYVVSIASAPPAAGDRADADVVGATEAILPQIVGFDL